MQLISVIIPTFNTERFIRETIASILAQTFKDLEIIVVDDGSTDRTCALIREMGPQIRLIEQKNSGVSVARNRGAAEARGRYLCFMDHDDYWFPDKLEMQIAEMERDDRVGVVYSTFLLWRPAETGAYPEPQGFTRNEAPDALDPDHSGWIYRQLLIDCWVLTSSAMIRADVFRAENGFDESLPFSEDWDLWLRLSRVCRFSRLVRPTTLYRQHPDQGSGVFRAVDYRTRLLNAAVRKWGLAGPDGTALSRAAFRSQLSRYHMLYGLHCLKANHVPPAWSSLVQAWLVWPFNLKSLAYIPASALGWRPSW